VSIARSFAAAFLPFPVECPRRSPWRGEARVVEVYVLPSPTPLYPLWGAQSRGVTTVVYCRSRVFNVAVVWRFHLSWRSSVGSQIFGWL